MSMIWEPVYDNFFLKTKKKSCFDEATDFHDKELPTIGSNYICLAVISLESALKKIKTFSHKCFQKNTNTLKRKKKWIDKLLKTGIFKTKSDKIYIKTKY